MEVCKAVQFIFLVCCAVKINGQEEQPPDLTFLSTEQKVVVARSKSKLELAATIAESMAQNAYTQVLVSANSFSSKLATAKDKVKNLEKNILGSSEDDAEGKAERISGALEGVGDGLVGMIQGIKGGDWVQGVQGALGIVSSLVALAGPIGMIASSILSMMSSFFGLFGGSETESQESMVKRVVEAAISDFRDKDMKEDIEGVKQVYQSLSSSVQNFRERKADMSASQAEELYNQIFMGLPVFGKLKARIGEKCEKPGQTFGDETIPKVTTCLNFVKLYSEASILRQLILADMASLLSELSEEKPNQAHLKITGNNILHIIKKEQENDKAILAPFADPLNHKEKRYTITILYTSIEEYKVLNSYMQTLHEKKNGVKKTEDANVVGGSIFKDYVLGCEHRMLQGMCVMFDSTTEYMKLADIEMDRTISSVFIPRGRSITAYKGEDLGGGELGPFVGPVVHGQVDGEDIWRSLKVETTTDSIDTHIRFCENENMHPSKRCDSIKDTGNDIDLSTILHRATPWSNKIQSIYVPPGKMVAGFTVKSADPYGPYIGPQLVNKVCHPSSSKWKFLSISSTTIDAQTLVLFCELPNLKGTCYRDQAIAYYKLDKVLGNCNVKNKIQSLKIPGGKQVTGYHREKLEGRPYGPYIGPITINEVDGKDGSAAWQSYKTADTPAITRKKKKKAARRFRVKERNHGKKQKKHHEESEEE